MAMGPCQLKGREGKEECEVFQMVLQEHGHPCRHPQGRHLCLQGLGADSSLLISY